MKLQRLQKEEYRHLSSCYIKSTLFKCFFILKKILKKKKKKKVTGKTPFFVIGPFCTHHSNYLDIGF